MAAPALTGRSSPPSGIHLQDGYRTLIAFNRNPNLLAWEKDVQPPGIDGGEQIQQTTMHNNVWRTCAPRSLKTLMEHTSTCAYDPAVYTDLVSLINMPTSITVRFPDGSTLSYFGYLKKAEIKPHVEGDQPEMTLTIVPTNWDYANHLEQGPVLVSVAGT